MYSLKIHEDYKEPIVKEFGMTLKDLEKSIELLKQWVAQQKHFPEQPTESMIEFFLINNKLSIETTKNKLDAYYTIRSQFPELYNGINPKLENIQRGLKDQFMLPLPQLLDNKYRVIFITVKQSKPDFCPVRQIANLVNLFEIRTQEDFSLGDIIVFDLKNVTLDMVIRTNFCHGKMAMTIYEIKFLDSIQALAEYIPLEMLPREYGGKEKSLYQLEELWKKKLEEYANRFDKLDTLRVDESLRAVPLKISDAFGAQGTFRKLDID